MAESTNFLKFNGRILWQKFPKIDVCPDETTFRILTVEPENGDPNLIVKGDIPGWDPDDLYEFCGEYTEDAKYGRGFDLKQIVRLIPETNIGREKYLAKWVEGIGAKTAKKLVNHFGSEIIAILDYQPSRLIECPGISEEKAAKIKLSWQTDHDPLLREVGIWLAEHEIGDTWAKKFIALFNNKVIPMLTENPYLAMKIDGIGFRKADELAKKLGWGERTKERTEAAVSYVVAEALGNGHCFLHEDELIKEVRRIASSRKGETNESKQLPLKDAKEAIEQAVKAKQLVKEENKINKTPWVFYYLPYIYEAEKRLAFRISELQSYIHIAPRGVEGALERAKKDLGYIPTEKQREGVISALKNNLSILTGGPGSGKTTVVKMLLRTAKRLGLKIALCAPTGRAAKRMTEITGEDATTIHKLLQWSPAEERFTRDADDPLNLDLLVLDEASMLDLNLADSVMQAVPDTCSVLFVGDIDQLPSVGPGMVLKDLIASKKIPVTTLDYIFRQADDSLIIKNAYKIKDGEMPSFPDVKKGREIEADSFFVEVPKIKNGPDSGKDDLEWIKQSLPAIIVRVVEKQKVDPVKQIQVLIPMRKGVAGVHEFNKVLQQALNPKGKELVVRGNKFRIGDRVMQLVNNYTPGIELSNGDIGFIKSFNEEGKEIVIDFYGSEVKYPFSDTDSLVLSYATTTHKSQGSEFDVVILILTNHHYSMLERNLLYTANTRAKNMIIYVASWQALRRAVDQHNVGKRNTFLAYRLINNIRKNDNA